ncbi:MAG: hypothetical protein JHC69_08375 [Akkermansiaceae bacterium]|nr:hypothetical protein [Akkermansiaceae bacterium]
MSRFLICYFFLAHALAQAAVDLDTDGYGDVWRLKYPGSLLSPNADVDGDGQSNLAEATIGTNPYDSQSTIRITAVQWANQQVHLTWPSLAGKRYFVESSATLASGTWSEIGTVIPGTGADVTTTLQSLTGMRFFRVRIFDVDTDADGVTDWEELQVGYDPNSNLQGDLARLRAALQSPSVVTVTASDTDAT